MDYLKFNCYDLAAQNTELQSVSSKMQYLAEELNGILGELEPQIKSYESLQGQLTAANNAAVDSAVRILHTHNALERIIDLYYAAENRTLQISEELPTGFAGKSNKHGFIPKDTLKIATSTINNSDLVLEDWLAELVLKYDGSENREL